MERLLEGKSDGCTHPSASSGVLVLIVGRRVSAFSSSRHVHQPIPQALVCSCKSVTVTVPLMSLPQLGAWSSEALHPAKATGTTRHHSQPSPRLLQSVRTILNINQKTNGIMDGEALCDLRSPLQM